MAIPTLPLLNLPLLIVNPECDQENAKLRYQLFLI